MGITLEWAVQKNGSQFLRNKKIVNQSVGNMCTNIITYAINKMQTKTVHWETYLICILWRTVLWYFSATEIWFPAAEDGNMAWR